MQLVNIKRLFSFLILVSLLVFSISVLGYVIFFRTVLAEEILPAIKHFIVFEEPDPPVPAISQEKPQVPAAELPMVSIIIDDMGYHEEVGDKLLKLPIELTFSFLPHAPFTLAQEETAYLMGRNVLLHLPLQPRDAKWDPGPGTLLLGDTPERYRELFEKNFNAVPHAIGVNNHMGSLFTEDATDMRRVLALVKEKDVFFVDSFTSAGSVGLELALEMGIPVARRHIFLDNQRSEEQICAQLERLVEVAEVHNLAVGIAHPYPETHQALKNCGPLYSKRIHFVGISKIIGYQ